MEIKDFKTKIDELLQPENGLLSNDVNLKFYKLYCKGKYQKPLRFYDFKLIDIRRPYDHEQLIRDGYHIRDVGEIATRYSGISFEYLAN